MRGYVVVCVAGGFSKDERKKMCFTNVEEFVRLSVACHPRRRLDTHSILSGTKKIFDAFVETRHRCYESLAFSVLLISHRVIFSIIFIHL